MRRIDMPLMSAILVLLSWLFIMGLVLLTLLVPAKSDEIIGGRPEGCPKKHCGCSLALNIFGRHVKSLWPAQAWFKFPQTSPHPGAVAVRQHHVMKLLYPQGGDWAVLDPNSGGGKTRIHVRSLAGFKIVEPQLTRIQ